MARLDSVGDRERHRVREVLRACRSTIASSRRAVATTSCPRLASSKTSARPMPLEEPVTNTRCIATLAAEPAPVVSAAYRL
jgi:hypothetical protein